MEPGARGRVNNNGASMEIGARGRVNHLVSENKQLHKMLEVSSMGRRVMDGCQINRKWEYWFKVISEYVDALQEATPPASRGMAEEERSYRGSLGKTLLTIY
jgi:hypothetical protein